MKKKNSLTKLLLRTMRGSYGLFVIALIASAVSILFSFLLPQVVGYTVDSVIGTHEKAIPAILQNLIDSLGGREGLLKNFIICALGVAVCAVISTVFNFISRKTLAHGTERFTRKLRDSLFSHVQHLPFSWHTETQTGDIIQRCTSDVETTKRFVSMQLIEVVRTVVLLIIAFIMMFRLDVKMAIVCGIFVPIILGYTMIFFKQIAKKFLHCDEAEGDLMVKVQENLTGVRVVRAFGRERYEIDSFDEKCSIYSNSWTSLGYTMGIYWGLGDIVSALQLLAVVSAGAFFAAKGEITLGDMLIFISYTQTIAGPVRHLGRVVSDMSKTGVALQRINEIFDAETEKEPENAKEPPMDRDITFKNVTFSYDGRDVLKDLSFTIPAGSTFGILGGTGSGKSTLTYVLNRLYDLPENGGSIDIGGVDIKEISLPHLRKNVGLVLQEPFLFSKTIFENIDIAAKTGDLEKVRESAKIAAVDKDIMSFTEGYDTVVGERGVTLSGGQKQRVAMARTLMLKSPIMVFDDSMSNLDMETDAQIRSALREGTGSSTVIIISHRISTLMQADNILVLEDGKCAELGSHRELMEKDGIYRRIYEIQAGLDRKEEN